ncbi:hypothetical protein [Pararhodobacter sp. SW119]|uniref:hypothetical protein n=1 Tax=Pararhodobacter sp. SW119 TaxID=2780075 RepID=UPI0032AF5E35
MDDHALLKQLTTQLEALRYKVFAASEGAPALDILRERSDIDLLFSDIVLPGGMNAPIVEASAAMLPERA